MLSTTTWLRISIYFGCIGGWTSGARPQFDTSTNMGLVLVPADAEVDSVIFRLRATDQDADFPLIFDITAAVQPIVRVSNLPCTLYNKVCQANVILTRRLVPGRLHDFAVRVRDSKGDSNSMQATISVTNATTPRDMIFPHVPSIIMVPEDTKPGKELDYLLVRANPWHGKPVYIELWQPKELFTIRQRQTPTQTRGVITLVGELDFETQSMYTLTMYATDPYTEPGKDTRNIAGVHVVVIVQDVQDVPPVFTIAPPLTRVNNSVKPGDVILRVHAEDGDKGTPREVTYGLVSEGNPFTPFFNISESTGEIILARPLEELTQITHVGAPILLTVVAEEVRRSREEPPGQATVVELGLLLGEPGNSPPYFESDSYMAWMDENAAPGTVVIFDKPDLAKVRDEDIGKTGVFALKLGNNNGTFEVTPTVAERVANFVVTVRDNILMDYEVRKTLEFTIIAQEVGPATNLSTSVPVTIFLKDINDNPPEFEKEKYEVTIAENVLPGTRVVQVQATDKDTGLSGSVKYTRIIGEGSETLTMDSETGLIIVAKDSTGLDRELTASLELSVEARDENGRGLRSTVPLIVNLLDVNDNAPIFEKSVYEFVLNSEQTNFTSPAFIKAIDADAEPPNNEVRYELVHGNYGNKFYLNEVTGELILKEPLNKSRKRRNNGYVNFATRFRSDFLQTLNTFQKIAVSTEKPLRIWKNRKKRAADDVLYTLTVRAYDSGVPHRSSTAKVKVITAAPAGALTLMLVVPGEHLDPIRTTETLASITGGRVTIQEIRPYDQPSRPGDGAPQGGKMSIVVARVEPIMSGTLLFDVETIHKSLVANGMGIVPVVNSNTNLANENPVGVTIGNTVGSSPGGVIGPNSNIGGSPGGIDGNNGDNAMGGTVVHGVNVGTNDGTKGTGQNADPGTGGGDGGNFGNTDTKTSVGGSGSTGGGSAGVPGGDTSEDTKKGSTTNGDSGHKVGGTNGGIASDNGHGTIGEPTKGGNNGNTAGGRDEANEGGISKETAGTLGGGTVGGNENRGSAGNPERDGAGGVVLGTNHQSGVTVNENFNKVNQTSVSSENEYIVYKAENKLLLWLLILLGLLMLLALLALILCCICPGCPFYMAPRKRRVHSFESVNHPDSRPKRHIRRKQLNPVKAEWSGKKQAWSADPMRRNWQFNRRNTKNRGLASLPGDVALIETPQALPKGPSLRLRDGPEPWVVPYGGQKVTEDRIYVEDVEAGRTYDTEDVDSLRRHEMERGSDVLRQSYHQADETLRLPREQHFYRDGNTEVLRLVTGGHVEGEDISLQAQRPTTLVNDQQALGYRNDGKDILLRRFIEDQNIRQHEDLHSSVQEISATGLEPGHQGGEQFLQKHEVLILPRNLEIDQRHHREERAPGVQRLIIDHGDIDDEEELRLRNHQFETQEADLRQQRKIAAAMLVSTAVSKATEKPMTNTRNVTGEQHTSSLNIPSYTIHDVELAKQNALLTQLLMDRDVRHLGVPGLDPGSYLETQSLPGQVAIATQTDRTAATQTENRSRSDNEESEEEIRSRRKSKYKKRFGNETRRSRSLLMKSPIQEESRSFTETRNSLLRRKAKEAREGRRATLEPEVLREISDSLDEQTSTPSLEEGQTTDGHHEMMQKAEKRGDIDEAEAAQLSEIANRSSPEISKDKYHRRSHAKAVTGDALQAQKMESSSRKQSSSRSQKNETKSGDTNKAKSTNGDKKESDESNSKKRSTESQSNISGTENKKESEDKKKRENKFLSKAGLLKSTSEKSIKKSKSRETEEPLVTKKRTMLRHQKAKKVSTESSEFEEIPVKSRQPSLKGKQSKQFESTSGSNLKQDSAKGKETSTLSDEPKSRSSGTDRDRELSKRYHKLSADSTSSAATNGQETIKNENVTTAKSRSEDTKEPVKSEKKKAEDLVDEQSNSKTRAAHELAKLATSTALISQNLKSNVTEIGKESNDAQESTTETVPDKSGESVPKVESEVSKSSAAPKKSELEPTTKDDSKISKESSAKSEEVTSKIDSELPEASGSSSTKKEVAQKNSEEVSKIDVKIPEVSEESEPSESAKNTLVIEKKLESGTTEVLEATEKIPDDLGAAKSTVVSGALENADDASIVQKEPEVSDEKVFEADEKTAEEPKKIDPDVSKPSVDIVPVEKRTESNTSEKLSAGDKIVDKSEETPSKSDPEGMETDPKTIVEEKKPELNTREMTEAFLQSEAMQSSHDLQVPLVVGAKDHKVPSATTKSVTPDPGDAVQKKMEKEDTSDRKSLVEKKIDDAKSGFNETYHTKVIESLVKNVHEERDGFVVIEHPEETQDTKIPRIVSRSDEERESDIIAEGEHESFTIIGKPGRTDDAKTLQAVSKFDEKTESDTIVEGQHDSFTIIGKPGETHDPKTSQTVSQPDENTQSEIIGKGGGSPQMGSKSKLWNDDKSERDEAKLAKATNGKLSSDRLEPSQSSTDKSLTPRHKSIEQGEIELPLTVKDGEIESEDSNRKSSDKNFSHTSEEDNYPKTGSPSFYILSSTSSTEDSIPDRETPQTQINSDQTLPQKAVTLVSNISKFPSGTEGGKQQTGKLKSNDKAADLADIRSGEWDTRQIQIGDISSDSPDNSQPYQTPRHRSKNPTGSGKEGKGVLTLQHDQNRELKKMVAGSESSDEKPDISISKVKDDQLTPRLIAEEAIRSGLEEVIESDGLKRESSSETSSKTSPGNQNERGETSKRKSGKEKSRIPLITEAKKTTSEKPGNNSQSGKKIEEIQEAAKTVRPKTEPKGGNPREGDTNGVRPRTQRGKASDSRAVKPQEVSSLREFRQEATTTRRSKAPEKSRQLKQNEDEIKPQDLSQAKGSEEGAISKEGYMSRYKQKREEMERRRRELKEAAEEEQRPRWQRKPAVIPPQRISRKELSRTEKPTDSKTPEGTTPRTRRKVKPLANAESEQLRAMVKEGRKLRKAEGGDSDDPTVEIFASEPPAKPTTNFQQHSYIYEKIPPPFYLHPPPPPQSTPQVSPLHIGPQDPRRPDDDLDSGIAVSLQGGTKLRHQQLLDKKSVFDIAYSEAAPSQLRTDSTTPPS